MQNLTTSSGGSDRIIPFPSKTASDHTHRSNLDLLSMIDQLAVMDDLWKLLFEIGDDAPKTRKDFKANISIVLKTMVNLVHYPSLEIGVKEHYTNKFYYYSHGVIKDKTNLKKWTYYKVISFLETSQILYLEKKSMNKVSHKRLSSKLFETLKFLSFITTNKNHALY